MFGLKKRYRSPTPTSVSSTADSTDNDSTSLCHALTYLSTKLQKKGIHLNLIIVQGLQPASLTIEGQIVALPASSLSTRTLHILEAARLKTAKKFPFLSTTWLSANTQDTDSLIHRSLRQNTVLFSTESLTLLAADHLHTLKLSLQYHESHPTTSTLSRCTELLALLATAHNGRPLTKGYVFRAYDHILIAEPTLGAANNSYYKRHGVDAVVMGSEDASSPPPDSAFGSFPRFPAHRTWYTGPKTPLRGSDITPITRTEWNFFMRPPSRSSSIFARQG
ncbi:MAG: hypothetical protein M1829_001927 [Trizodia sp. TS-e1964]|nr:MAG: hypothetical protein M1829_001927 [Trizodia sp. TS-e1964]